MVTVKNRFGLSRNVPNAVKQQLRQEAGFGCVCCGFGIYTYEHIIDFVNVDCHRPEDMALLCHQCQAKVTRRQLSKATVKRAKENPKALEVGFSREFFDTSCEQVKVI